MEPEDKQDKIELVAGLLRVEMNNTLSRFNIKSIQIQSTFTPKNTIQLMLNLESATVVCPDPATSRVRYFVRLSSAKKSLHFCV